MNLSQEETQLYRIMPGDSLGSIAQKYNVNMQDILQANPGIERRRIYRGQIIRIPNPCEETHSAETEANEQQKECDQQRMISDQSRMLWTQHVYWTRMYISSVLFDLPEEACVQARLLRNPKDFRAMLAPVYGEAQAQEFEALFNTHLTIASEFVKELKAGNRAAAAGVKKQWYLNADQIAVSLGSKHPKISAVEWQKMMYEHLTLTEKEIGAYLTKNYENSIVIFDEIEQEALKMADCMAQAMLFELEKCKESQEKQ